MTTAAEAHEFPAMGGTIEVQAIACDLREVERVPALFERHEQAMSRFRADSELNALNAATGLPFHASPLLFDVIDEAIGWACVTDGTFDPTVIDVLEEIGYDRSFEQLERLAARSSDGVRAPTVLERKHARKAGWRNISFDFDRSLLAMPADVRIDLGGIGKGYTVDRAIESLGARPNAMINASGDLYASGDGPDGDGWYVGVQDPFDPDADIVTLNVNDRGVATSGSLRRNWLQGDARYHHLIDTRTSTSAASDLVAVTVIALTATHADVLAKTAFVLGARAGLRLIERFDGAECIAVTADGNVLTSTGAGEYFA